MSYEPVHVEMLYFEGCPTTLKLRERLREAMAEFGDSLELVEVDLESLASDDTRRGYGSPTILVDGHELMGVLNPKATELSCRLYTEGVPSTVKIAELIKTHMR